MATYHIGEVCRLLQLKPHVLRYWEQEFSLLSPRKDAGGRRVYTARELNLLYRIRHLLYVEKYTVDGARDRLWRELADDALDAKARIQALRGALIDSSVRVRQLQSKANAVLIRRKLRAWGLEGTVRRVAALDPPAQERLLRDLHALPEGTIPWVLGLRQRQASVGGNEPVAVAKGFGSPVSEREWARAAELGGGIVEAGGVTLYVPLRRVGEAARLPGAVAEAVDCYGEAGAGKLLLVIAAPPRQGARVRRRLEEGGGLGLPASAVVVEPGVPVPAVNDVGEPVIRATGRLRLSAPGGAEVLSRVLRRNHPLSSGIRERKLLAVVLSPEVGFPRPAELGLHLLRGQPVSAWHRRDDEPAELVIAGPEAVAQAAESLPWRAYAVSGKGLTGRSSGDDTKDEEIVEFRKEAEELSLRAVHLRRLPDASGRSTSGGNDDL